MFLLLTILFGGFALLLNDPIYTLNGTKPYNATYQDFYNDISMLAETYDNCRTKTTLINSTYVSCNQLPENTSWDLNNDFATYCDNTTNILYTACKQFRIENMYLKTYVFTGPDIPNYPLSRKHVFLFRDELTCIPNDLGYGRITNTDRSGCITYCYQYEILPLGGVGILFISVFLKVAIQIWRKNQYFIVTCLLDILGASIFIVGTLRVNEFLRNSLCDINPPNGEKITESSGIVLTFALLWACFTIFFAILYIMLKFN